MRDWKGSPQISDIDVLIDAIADLQVAVSEAAHNPLQATLETFFIDLLLNVQIKLMRNRGIRFWQERAAAFQGDRRTIIDAITARDAAAAIAAMSAYLDHQRRTFIPAMKKEVMLLAAR